MFYKNATNNSPKIIIDFPKLLFEMSGCSNVENALQFYQPVFNYVANNFYQIKNTIYQKKNPSITLHFYLKYVGMQDVEMLRQLDSIFFKIKEFNTFIYWYYNPHNTENVELANDIKLTFLNHVRLIENSVHV